MRAALMRALLLVPSSLTPPLDIFEPVFDPCFDSLLTLPLSSLLTLPLNSLLTLPLNSLLTLP